MQILAGQAHQTSGAAVLTKMKLKEDPQSAGKKNTEVSRKKKGNAKAGSRYSAVNLFEEQTGPPKSKSRKHPCCQLVDGFVDNVVLPRNKKVIGMPQSDTSCPRFWAFGASSSNPPPFYQLTTINSLSFHIVYAFSTTVLTAAYVCLSS